MRVVDPRRLQPGSSFPGPLLHKSGIEMVAAEERISAEILETLRRAEVGALYLVESNERVEAVRRELVLMPVPVDDIAAAGGRLARPVYDNDGTLLLEAGASVPRNFAESLARRGIHAIYYRKPETAVQSQAGRELRERLRRIRAEATPAALRTKAQEMDALSLEMLTPEAISEEALACQIEQSASLEVLPQGEALLKELRLDQKMVMASPEEKAAFLDVYQDALQSVRDLFLRLTRDARVDGAQIRRVAQEAVAALVRNRELLMAAGQMTLPGNYLVSHAVAVAVLAINIGTAMGLGKAQVLALGHSALLHDVGMLQLPASLVNKPGKLTRQEWREICRHPVIGLDILQNIVGIPAEVPFVVYQSHERSDGSGYPRGKNDAVIHTYAKIVAAADTYHSLVSERPHRPARSPYEAMEQLVLLCGQRALNPKVVRAFLTCVSMFPVGSWVELSDGSRARVVASNDADYMRPVVSVMFNERGDRLPKPVRIDLMEKRRLAVRKALYEAEVGAVDLMDGF